MQTPGFAAKVLFDEKVERLMQKGKEMIAGKMKGPTNTRQYRLACIRAVLSALPRILSPSRSLTVLSNECVGLKQKFGQHKLTILSPTARL